MKRWAAVAVLLPVFLSAWGDDLAKQNRSAIASMRQQLQLQQERIDGLVSVIEGLNETIGELRRGRHKRGDGLTALRRRIEALEARVEAQERYIKRLRAQQARAKVAPSRQSTAQTLPKQSSEKQRLSSSKRYKQAIQAYKKRAYQKAKRIFAQLAQEGYKPAASNFYLGEIAYYTRNYDDAVYYYKKSAQLYDKASYMDVLMLHTAIALENRGKKKQAKEFYMSVVELYKGRKSARIAAKRLKRLK